MLTLTILFRVQLLLNRPFFFHFHVFIQYFFFFPFRGWILVKGINIYIFCCKNFFWWWHSTQPLHSILLRYVHLRYFLFFIYQSIIFSIDGDKLWKRKRNFFFLYYSATVLYYLLNNFCSATEVVEINLWFIISS